MVKVFYAEIPKFFSDIKINCEERKKYLDAITDDKSRKHSFYVWVLLEHAIKYLFSEQNFIFICEKGKWKEKDDKLFFSLTHSSNIVAVAISKTLPVGLDVECVSDKLFSIKKFLKLPENITDKYYLARKWTEYESVIKLGEERIFSSETISDSECLEYCLTLNCSKKIDTFFKIQL